MFMNDKSNILLVAATFAQSSLLMFMNDETRALFYWLICDFPKLYFFFPILKYSTASLSICLTPFILVTMMSYIVFHFIYLLGFGIVFGQKISVKPLQCQPIWPSLSSPKNKAIDEYLASL